jgi:hypothetical protein
MGMQGKHVPHYIRVLTSYSYAVSIRNSHTVNSLTVIAV